ncbi:MAG: tyrosine--tRNA ligase [Desulfobacteraceae bacterium]|nr:MAG: tyrosine--tRNA ligase [Desulfobacteraceae bacterium]
MANLVDTLRERGFIEQTTHDEELREAFEAERVTGYIGFDPTAASLHIGSLVPIMALAHMQRAGHRPIALVGGGTGMVGDPSGKTEMRKILTLEEIAQNVEGIKRQLSRFIDFSDGRALMLNNAEWLTPLAYIPFLRDIGRHFSVNRMIKAESYKMRLDSEDGLSFIEFNYMVLQAYDFLELLRRHGCRLQMGGSDQWGNIVAGVELIRRAAQQTVFGITFPLITTSAGAKMGKTARGAVWLDAARTSPYAYFQYWVNTDDRDVGRFLSLFTFLPLDEIRAAVEAQGAALNAAKTILAFEATRLAHGSEEALLALQGAQRLFGARELPEAVLPSSTIPRRRSDEMAAAVPFTVIRREQLRQGIPAFRLLQDVGLAASGAAARRLIEQGGAYVNGERVEVYDRMITEADLSAEDCLLLRCGKKKHHQVRVEK